MEKHADPDSWWWCLDHHRAEPYFGCRSATRLGPYATPGEAEQALERAAERNEAWKNDPRYQDPDAGDDADDDDGDRWGLFS
jgi:hypothetical protein